MATYTDPTTIISTGKVDPVQPGAVVFLIGSFLTVLVAGVFYLSTLSTQSKTKTAQENVVIKKAELEALKPTADALQQLSDQAKGLHTIFDSQKRMVSVFMKVAERLHVDMVVTAIQVSDKGVVTLTGRVNDYVTYAKVFQAFTNEKGKQYFATAKPVSVSKIESEKENYITFTFNLTLAPGVLTAVSAQEVAATQ